MAIWKNETEMFELMKSELYSAVLGDILDGMGYFHQFLPPNLRPLREHMKLAGRAMTALYMDVFGAQAVPFGKLAESLDAVKPGEIYVASGGSQNCAYWGELMTSTVKSHGGVGGLINGYHRDTPQVLEQELPVFSWGSWAQDSSVRTSVAEYRCRIEIGNIPIDDGDFIFGDVDGVLVIPKDRADEVVEKALVKARGEREMRKAIEAGMTVSEAYAKFGYL